MKFHIFHNWSTWSDAMREGSHIIQYRYCRKCRKVQKRLFN